MAGRESAAVERAVAASLADPARSLRSLAVEHDVASSSLRRALRARGVPARTAPAGPAHHAYLDGRTAQRAKPTETPCAAV